MNFDLHEFEYLPAFATWGVVFFAVFSVGAAIAVACAPIVAGRNGRKKLFKAATSGPLGLLCIITSVVATVGFGVLAWFASAGAGQNVYTYLAFISDPELRRTIAMNTERTLITAATAFFSAFGGLLLFPALADALKFNLGRVWTIAVLTWQEVVRKRTLFVFMVFALLFMFAGWFLTEPDQRPDDLVKNYVTFVLWALNLLTLPVILLLACWGIPDDIKARSMHTVVTKPVKRNEIYLGRILGYTFVATAVVLIVGLVGYLWIIQQVPRSITKGDVLVDGREVRFSETVDGGLRVEVQRIKGEPDVYTSPSPADMRRDNPEVYDLYRRAHRTYVNELLTARVPVYADRLLFYDRAGNTAQSGINVGDIWEHRSYVEGGEGSQARGSYIFENFTPDLLQRTTAVELDANGDETSVEVERLRLESSFEAFRTFKGDMDRSLLVQYHFVSDLRTQLADDVAGVEMRRAGAAEFLPIRRSISQGSFPETAEEFARLANGFRSGAVKLSEGTGAILARGYDRVAELFEGYEEQWAATLADAARGVARAARANDNEAMATALDELGTRFAENVDAVTENVVDIDVPYKPFPIKEFHGNTVFVPRELRLRNSVETVDLFDDVAHDGKLKIQVACLDRSQYLGMARPDLYVRKPDNWFAVGFAKALLGMWLYLVLILVVGVTASTFVKGPVATFLLAFFVLLGSQGYDFLQKVVSGELKGSGTIESSYRLYAHLNPNVDLDQTATVQVIQGADTGIKGFLWVVSRVLPDLEVFWLAGWVSNGIDVNWSAGLSYCVFTTLAYLLPCLLLGYYSLRFRELEAK